MWFYLKKKKNIMFFHEPNKKYVLWICLFAMFLQTTNYVAQIWVENAFEYVICMNQKFKIIKGTDVAWFFLNIKFQILKLNGICYRIFIKSTKDL